MLRTLASTIATCTRSGRAARVSTASSRVILQDQPPQTQSFHSYSQHGSSAHLRSTASITRNSQLRLFSSSTALLASDNVFSKIACIGTGKMAQAVIEPMIGKEVQSADGFTVYDVSTRSMEAVQSQLGVQTAKSLRNLVEGADLVLCCVKPQNLTDSFFQELRKSDMPDDAILLSVCAGKSMDTFRAGGFEKIVRSMPNTPATIGQGMTVWSCTDNLTVQERKKIRKVLSSCGKSMYVDDESFIDMATSISGSGPAYIFMLMESMIDAGVHMGFPRDKAATLVYHTMLGSTLYAMETGEHPAILRNSVTSPNGTTASALYELENGRFRTVIKDAMWACYRRSLEMGNHNSNVGPGRQTAPPSSHLKISTDSDDDSDSDSESTNK